MPWDGAFKCCEIWVQSKIWAVCRGSNHGKPHDDNYQCFDRCSRKCWVLRVLLPKPNGLDFEYEQAYQFHYQQNLWRQLPRTVCLFDFNELHTMSLMWESFGCSLFAFQIGQYPFDPFWSLLFLPRPWTNSNPTVDSWILARWEGLVIVCYIKR